MVCLLCMGNPSLCSSLAVVETVWVLSSPGPACSWVAWCVWALWVSSSSGSLPCFYGCLKWRELPGPPLRLFLCVSAQTLESFPLFCGADGKLFFCLSRRLLPVDSGFKEVVCSSSVFGNCGSPWNIVLGRDRVSFLFPTTGSHSPVSNFALHPSHEFRCPFSPWGRHATSNKLILIIALRWLPSDGPKMRLNFINDKTDIYHDSPYHTTVCDWKSLKNHLH